MYNLLENLNINLSNEERVLFESFSDLFLDYNKNVNLISKNDEKFLFQKHIYDSLSFSLFERKYLKSKSYKLLDIGAGGGFPSLPLALHYKNFQITPLDSINKKINFINIAKEKLNLQNVYPICSRVEDLPESMKNSYDIVVSRAMAELRMILEYSIPFVKTGGYFVAYKSIKSDDEIENAKKALSVLNSVVVDKIDYALPINDDNKRVLIVVKKTKDILNSFPRKNGLVKKRPL